MHAQVRHSVATLFLCCAACRSGPAEFVRVKDGPVALTHVRVIDGTGAPAKEDQTIIIDGGRILEVGDASRVRIEGGTETLDLHGDTALPGLVGMHDHLFYALPPGSQYQEMLATFPKLYLAAGVTSLRTAGALNLEAEQRAKQRIDQGKELGPHLYLSSPYINPEANEPENPAGYAQAVEQIIPSGINSVKVYTHARASELAAVIQAAHRHAVRVTGHLCAVGFTEAAALGIDNLEHGLVVDTEFYSGRQRGVCPDSASVVAELVHMDMHGPRIQGLIRTLVERQVAITSTLPVFETFAGSRIPKLDGRALIVLDEELQSAYLAQQSDVARHPDVIWGVMLKKEMEFEREFVKAGGLLMAGVDPTGWGGAIAGFGDQHEVELLVEAGFTPEQAIQIATYNGASFLRQSGRIGSLSPGKHADILVVRGNPVKDITAIRHTEIVFKDGVGYDSTAILQSLTGQVGR